MSTDLAPVSLSLVDVDVERQTTAMEYLDRCGAYDGVCDGAIVVPRRSAREVANPGPTAGRGRQLTP